MTYCAEMVDLVRSELQEVLTLRDKLSKKSDGSYVSGGDLHIQSVIFKYVLSKLPSHELISEELAPFGEREWDPIGSYVVLDPIDGTENFVSGLREWGVGISIYTDGVHQESCIYLPELDDFQITGMPMQKFSSRIYGLSSSLNKQDLLGLPDTEYEFRITGCSMYNCLAAVRGAFVVFENVKGVNCWDVLPGLNLALEHGCQVSVDSEPYHGQILFPVSKYKIRISNLRP